MTTDLAIALAQDMLWTALLICAPVLGFSMLVGLVISVFQVVTQLQEMSLTFVPKIVTVALVLIGFGGWMLNTLTDFSSRVIANVPWLVW